MCSRIHRSLSGTDFFVRVNVAPVNRLLRVMVPRDQLCGLAVLGTQGKCLHEQIFCFPMLCTSIVVSS